MPYVLGIDIGCTSTTAAVSRLSGTTWARPEVVQLDTGSPVVPSVLYLSADGSLTVGEPGRDGSGPAGGQIARGFCRRIGDDVPLMFGGEECTPQTLTAVLAMWVVEQVAGQEGEYAEQVVLSHPGGWGPYRRELLHEALREIGLAHVTLLPEPITVAESHAARGFTGGIAAIYSLGGNSFEASTVQPGQRSGFKVLGTPQGLEPIGGADFDAALAEHVRTALGKELARSSDPHVRFALAGLPAECARAKQDLTVTTETDVVVGLPHGQVRVPVTRAEFEEMIRPAVQVTVDLLVRAVRSGGRTPAQLDGVLLAGGSARIPLVAELLAARFSGPFEVEADPQVTAATGAALAAGQIVSPPPPRRPDRGRPGPVQAVGPGGREPALGPGRNESAFRPGGRESAFRPGRDESAFRPGGRESALRAERGTAAQLDDQGDTPPPRPPVKITPLELPSLRVSRLVPGRRGRGRG